METQHASVDEQLDLLISGTEFGDAAVASSMREELRKLLLEKRPLTVYLGADPTSPNLHLGHAVVLHKLAQFQRLGHRVLFVIGDFTAMIGDPTGRSKTRPPLSREQIEANARTYADQVFKVLRRDDTELVYNSSWLDKMALQSVIKLLSGFTVAQMLTREDFQKRFTAEAPIHLHELLYSLTQGEDAAHLKADVQVGGVDQLLNIMTGRDVMRGKGLRPQVVLTMPLLPGTDGKVKMSKSYGNDIGIALPPSDMYGKVMSLPDIAMADYFRLASGMTQAAAEDSLRAIAQGSLHPRDAKMQLAHEIVSRWHGQDAAAMAEAAFVAQFQKREAPEALPELKTAEIENVLELLMATKIPQSRGEARRLIDGGGVTIDGQRQSSAVASVPPHVDGAILRVGKRHLFKLITRS